MGNQGAQQQGLPHAPDDINETIREHFSTLPCAGNWLRVIAGMMKTIEGATRESCGGWLTNWSVPLL